MNVTVRLSAGLAQECGASRLVVLVAEGATVADLLARLRETYPTAERLAHALPIVAGQYVSLSQRLAANQEVALLLPVAGG